MASALQACHGCFEMQKGSATELHGCTGESPTFEFVENDEDDQLL